VNLKLITRLLLLNTFVQSRRAYIFIRLRNSCIFQLIEVINMTIFEFVAF